MSHPRGKTRKNQSKSRKQGHALTIPELRSSLEHITGYTDTLIRSGNASIKQVASSFATEWKRVFGKKLSTKVAESYIKSMMKIKKGTRKMRGGNHMLSGAPLDYKTGPGVELPYGKFPEFISKGFVNPVQGISSSCGSQQGVVQYAGTGSNKMSGGGIFDYMLPPFPSTGYDINAAMRTAGNAAVFRPFSAQNPQTYQHNMMTGIKGMTPHPGPESWQRTWVNHTNPNTPPGPRSVDVLSRELRNDVIVPGTDIPKQGN